MSDLEQEPEAKAATEGAPAPRKKKKKKLSRRPKRPLTETEIASPDRHTLGMMGVLMVTSITLWIFAHAACNYHPPRETRRPRDVTTADLTHDPKDAAMEFIQRWAELDYKGALEIAAGPVVDDVKKDQAACQADAAACAKRRKAAESVLTTAVVLEPAPGNTKVRAVVHRSAEGDKTYLVLVERDATGWKVTARVADVPGASLPAPSLPPMHGIPLQMVPMASPGASAGSTTIRLVPPPNAPPPNAPPPSNP